MITQIIIKQEKEQSKNFYLHTKGTGILENFSTFAFEAFTTDELKKHVSEIIKEYNMAEKYTIGVTETKKIQVILKAA